MPPDEGSIGPVFDDAEDRENALRVAAAGPGRFYVPQVFRYGIQFRPDRLISRGSAAMQGHRRAVQFFFVAEGCTVRDVLARVRGGVIVSAKETVRHSTIRVVFHREEDAARYAEFAESATDLIRELGPNVVTAFLETETYPDAPAISIATAEGWTRCISVGNFDADWKDSDTGKGEMSSMWEHHLCRIWTRPQDRLEDA